jgi:predicted membrane protein
MSKSRSMNFISSGTFWGVLIILFGLSILLREVFHIHIPFMKIIFGLFLIYLGVRVIAGGAWKSKASNTSVFTESDMHYDPSHDEYDIVFGSGTIDLFKMETPTQKRKIEVSVVFGNGTVIVNDSIPMKIEMNSVFGASVLEDKRVNALGTSYNTTSAYKEGQPYVLLETNVVFGKLTIQSKKW